MNLKDDGVPNGVDEIWVEIEGFPNYAVSNYGQVINKVKNREMKPIHHHEGYYTVALSNKGVTKRFLIHRLVAEAFFIDFTSEVDVRHINGETSDNSVLNLTLRSKSLRNAKKVRVIETGQVFDSVTQAANALFTVPRNVLHVLNNTDNRKTAVGYTFEYVKEE